MALRYLLYYAQQTGLWSYDETTGVASNIAPFPASPGTAASIAQMAVAGGFGYFTNIVSGGGGNQIDLWRTDGTAGGTVLVTSYADFSSPDTPPVLVGLANGNVAFEIYNGSTYNLYVSNGTSAGTTQVASYTGNAPIYLAPGASGEVGGYFLFVDQATGLWSLNESTGVASNVSNFVYTGNVAPSISVVGGTAYVASITAGTTGSTLRILATNGTTAGTSVLATLPDNSGGAFPDNAAIQSLTTLANNNIAFDYNDGLHKYLDVLNSGTSTITTISSFAGNAESSALYLGAGDVAQVNGDFLFIDQATGLWSLNEATNAATNIASFTYAGAVAPSIAAIGGTAYFTEITALGSGAHVIGLWQTNGSTGGTSEVTSFVDNTPTASLGADSAGIQNLTALGNGEVSFSYFDGVSYYLYVSNGTAGGTAQVGSYTGTQPFTLASGQATQIACFTSGTMLATMDGMRAVERIAAGDVLRCGFAGSQSVVWAGSVEIDCAAQAQPHRFWPVRISAGAFGAGLPRRDLVLSPDHAVFVDGVLIPVKRLVNGVTVRQEPARLVRYHHIAFARHDVVFAEGLATESYLDAGMADLTAAMRAPADCAAMWEARGCAPLVLYGPALERVRARLAAASLLAA